MCHLCQQKYTAMQADNVLPQSDLMQQSAANLVSDGNVAGQAVHISTPEASSNTSENGQ